MVPNPKEGDPDTALSVRNRWRRRKFTLAGPGRRSIHGGSHGGCGLAVGLKVNAAPPEKNYHGRRYRQFDTDTSLRHTALAAFDFPPAAHCRSRGDQSRGPDEVAPA